MNIDFRELARDPVWLLGGAVGLDCREVHHPHRPRPAVSPFLARLSIEMGLLLGPGGEFAFVGIGMATDLGLIDAKASRASRSR